MTEAELLKRIATLEKDNREIARMYAEREQMFVTAYNEKHELENKIKSLEWDIGHMKKREADRIARRDERRRQKMLDEMT